MWTVIITNRDASVPPLVRVAVRVGQLVWKVRYSQKTQRAIVGQSARILYM